MSQKTVLPLNVIHVCINLQELNTIFDNSMHAFRFARNIFKKRLNYSDNWVCKGDRKNELSTGIIFLRRLLVNGFAIEIYQAHPEILEYIQDYNQAKLAGIDIRSINEASLDNLKKQCFATLYGMYKFDDSKDSPYQKYCHKALQRLNPYKQDLIKILFNENIDIKKLQVSTIVSNVLEKRQAKEPINTNLPIRLANLVTKKRIFKNTTNRT